MMPTPDHFSNLSPQEQRALLAALLKKRAGVIPPSNTERDADFPSTADRGSSTFEAPAASNSFPMSVGQQGLWYAFCRDRHATSFNVFLPARIRSAMNLDALRASIEYLANRHSCFRTTFSDRSGQLTQTVHPNLVPEFKVIDIVGLRSNVDADLEETIRQVVTKETQRPFDLENGPLLRMAVYPIASDDFVVLASTHHIVVDFWSLILVLSELRNVYPAILNGRSPQLPPSVNNYAEFVREQRQLIDGPGGRKLKSYWQRQLENCPTTLELVPDFIRPDAFTGRADIVSLNIPPALSSLLQNVASSLRVTPFTVIHAGLQVLLAKMSGQQEFMIGSPFSGRSHSKFESTVGFFVNMLPLRANLTGQPSFAELIRRTNSALLDALEHESYPFSSIVKDIGPPRDPSRSPLFQVSCTFEKSQLRSEMGRAGFLFPDEKETANMGGLHQESFYIPQTTCHYDIEFIFEQAASSIRGMICYCRDLFAAESMESVATTYVAILESLCQDPQRSIAEAIATSRLSRSLLNVPTQSRSNELPQTVVAMLDAAMSSYPKEIALRDGDRTWTYQQLREELSKLSHDIAVRLDAGSLNLRDDKAKHQPILPVLGPPGAESTIGILAAMQAGAAPVPVDIAQPAIEREQLIQETKARWFLEAPFSGQYLATRKTFESAGQLRRHAQPGDLAYMIYTSGSTGRPKGVMVEHQAICNTLHWRRRALPLSQHDRVLMLLSHQFDAGLGICLAGLTSGATLVWADAPSRTDLHALIEQIQRDQITILPAIPSMLQMLVEHPRFNACTSLRQIWTGGEAMPRDLPRQLRQRSSIEIWNLYGPTEAAVEAIACNVTAHDSKRPIPLGRAIDNTTVLVLDDQLNPVPDAFPGQLAIAGPGLARGYLGAPELTEQKFPARIVSDGRSLRFYLTGDRGRRLPDGQYEFLGRIDHQVKVRGYRIELEEIEQQFELHPAVDRAALKVQDAGTPHAQLVGYLKLHCRSANVSEDQSRQLLAEVRRAMAARLPGYKMPAHLLVMADMPLTSSGKIDRKRLPAVSATLEDREHVEPGTPLEHYLAKAWCSALGREKVSVDQDFFELGGSSLQAAMLTSKLTADLGIHVPTSLLFDLADISKVAQRLVQLYEVQIAERFGMASVTHYAARSSDAMDIHADANSSKSMHPLIAPLKSSGTRRPIFMVHPPGGIVLCYRELASRIGVDQPIFGVRSRGLHGNEQLPDSIEQAAADYLQAIRSVSPNGPYTIGGWSLGGIFAYEMARQLRGSGQQVDRLILMDTTIPEGSTDLVDPADLVHVGKEYGVNFSLRQLTDLRPEEQLPFLWQHAQRLGVLNDQTPPEIIDQVLKDLKKLFHHHMYLATLYRIRPMDCQLLLIRPKDVPFHIDTSEDRGWRQLVKQVDVRFMSGHHHSMVQMPHVLELANLIESVVAAD